MRLTHHLNVADMIDKYIALCIIPFPCSPIPKHTNRMTLFPVTTRLIQYLIRHPICKPSSFIHSLMCYFHISMTSLSSHCIPLDLSMRWLNFFLKLALQFSRNLRPYMICWQKIGAILKQLLFLRYNSVTLLYELDVYWLWLLYCLHVSAHYFIAWTRRWSSDTSP